MIDFTPKHDFLVGIDSDGCAFDTMELKHKECFIPNIINHYQLQGVSKYAREAAEFVNLYSKSRGINRFPALVEVFEWLNRRPEVQTRGVRIEIPSGLTEWLRREPKPSRITLTAEFQRTGDADLKRVLEWSDAVDAAIAEMVRGVPPFPSVRPCLAKLNPVADVLVVSATPGEALRREWAEHDLAQYAMAIFGQEQGTKADMLRTATTYRPGHAMMIGDAPGDYRAAAANHVLFFPINPGEEEASWQRFFEEGCRRFLAGQFTGEYQTSLLAEFDRCLPDRPPWPVEG